MQEVQQRRLQLLLAEEQPLQLLQLARQLIHAGRQQAHILRLQQGLAFLPWLLLSLRLHRLGHWGRRQHSRRRQSRLRRIWCHIRRICSAATSSQILLLLLLLLLPPLLQLLQRGSRLGFQLGESGCEGR